LFCPAGGVARGELVFRRGEAEVFRLSGVLRPDVFRQVCLKARKACVSFDRLEEEQRAVTAS